MENDGAPTVKMRSWTVEQWWILDEWIHITQDEGFLE